jgi:hypothetical protein
MSDGQVWFCLIAGAVITFLAVMSIIGGRSARRTSRMAVDSVVNGRYSKEEIDRIIMNWATTGLDEGDDR